MEHWESGCPFTVGTMAATHTTEAIMEATRTTAVPITAYGYYPYGYIGSYYGSNYPYYSNRTVYRGCNGSVVVARVQERLARAGYYAGRINGVMGPRTRYATRAYERRHGLPAYGVIDRRLLTTMGVA